MQFQIACKHCHRPFVIQSEGGNTLRCNCPYCGESMTVATPQMGVPDGSRLRDGHSEPRTSGAG